MRKLSQISVADFYKIDEEPPIMISQSEDFGKVIDLFASSSELKGIFVTDQNNRLCGVITRSDLLDWTRVQVGEFFDDTLQSPEKTIRLSQLIHATTVGEVMRPESAEAAVNLSDTAKTALQKMIELDIFVIPVVDNNNNTLGDIKLSEILAASLSL